MSHSKKADKPKEGATLSIDVDSFVRTRDKVCSIIYYYLLLLHQHPPRVVILLYPLLPIIISSYYHLSPPRGRASFPSLFSLLSRPLCKSSPPLLPSAVISLSHHPVVPPPLHLSSILYQNIFSSLQARHRRRPPSSSFPHATQDHFLYFLFLFLLHLFTVALPLRAHHNAPRAQAPEARPRWQLSP